MSWGCNGVWERGEGGFRGWGARLGRRASFPSVLTAASRHAARAGPWRRRPAPAMQGVSHAGAHTCDANFFIQGVSEKGQLHLR